jgi:hypothetical protein
MDFRLHRGLPQLKPAEFQSHPTAQMKASNRLLRNRIQLAQLLVLFAAFRPALSPAVSPTTTPEQIAFFEKNVRPVLVEHCYQCHSEKARNEGKLKGGLFLDSREGVITGGDSGPAIVAGDPSKSLLANAVRWENSDTQMPPKKKLPAMAIAHLEQWIAMGAPDPRDGAPITAKRQINIAEGREHWAFKPLRNGAPPIPPPSPSQKPTTVDAFILQAQANAGVRPSPPAAKETLVRRLYFDLTGLPPTPEAVESFLSNTAPDAYSKLVNSLLDSPLYGERWARHWLDVVRFAESGGYEFDGFRQGAYHYRDWVIRAFNSDLPYDEFVRLQLAGDLLDENKIEGAAATGFLVAGPYPGQITAKTKERIRYDQLDDMLSTTGSAMLGLTIGCVRCHDHKYDPIPQADYYNLAATLAKTEHGEVKIERYTPEQLRLRKQYDEKSASLQATLSKFAKEDFPNLYRTWRNEQPAGLGDSTGRWQVFDVTSVSAENAHLAPTPGGLVVYLDNKTKDDVYTVKVRTLQKGLRSFRLEALTEDNLPKRGPGLSDNGNFVLADFKATAKPLDATSKTKPAALKLKAVKASFEQKSFPLANAVDNDPSSGWAVDPQQGKDHAALFHVEGDVAGFEGGTEIEFQLRFKNFFGLGKFRLSFSNSASPPELEAGCQPQDAAELLFSETLPSGAGLEALAGWFGRFNPKAQALTAALQEHAAKAPHREYAQIYSTKQGGADVYLLRRGEVDNKAGLASPGFVQVLSRSDASRWTSSPKDPQPIGPASEVHPRVALGRWLTDMEHGAGPLLARVIVNRLWQHHFGKGLVPTPNEFGVQGEKPSHPELLDYLAGELVRSGWSLKSLHRLLLNSAVYQQGNSSSKENAALDPDNKLLWFHPSQRLEAEAIRDSLLQVAGNLDPRPFGPSETRVDSPRRSVYLRVRRSELIPFLTLFDAPEPLQSVGERGLTTVPTQALTLLNSPFVRDCAQKLARRALSGNATPKEALAKAFEIALSRKPEQAELVRFTSYLETQLGENPTPESSLKALSQTCLALLCTNEFIYVD